MYQEIEPFNKKIKCWKYSKGVKINCKGEVIKDPLQAVKVKDIDKSELEEYMSSRKRTVREY